MSNVQNATAEVAPLIADFREATAKLQKVMDNANGLLDEDRDRIRTTIEEMQKTLVSARVTIEQLQSILVANGDNVDLMLDNFRQVSDNFREFTDTLKRQPSALIWKDTTPDRKPPSANGKTKGEKDPHP
jgi:ABC-type transporter Mla subunit MlaD